MGAIFAVTLKLSSTVKNLPNPPAGDSTASMRFPTDPEAYAEDQDATDGVAAANAAPRH